MRRLLPWLGALALIAAIFAAIVSLAPARKRPNVLLITFDATRGDHMDWASGRKDVTPMLDALVARGTWFKADITAQPLTLPSHTSIMTGLYPYHHGVRNNGTYIVPPDAVTLAERLKDAGYQTHGIVSAFVLDSQFGLDQGFDSYDDDLSGGPEQKMFMFKEVRADRTAARAVQWLTDVWNHQDPFFMWVHFFDPHADYEPPADIAARFPGDPYTGEIAFADRELGRVIKELDDRGQLDNTIIVFTSDHGEGLGEHGEDTHGLFVYDSTTHVPLVFKGPGVPAGGRVDDVVRSVDIVPTVLDLLGLAIPDGLDGQSLVPVWHGDTSPRVAYTETLVPRLSFGWSEVRALRADQWKVVDAPRDEVYDMATDPHELHDLAATQAGSGEPLLLFNDMTRRVAEDPFAQGSQAPSTMDSATRAKLAALGYVSDAPKTTGPLADPKDRLPFWKRFQKGQDLLRLKRYDEAEATIRALVNDDPGNVLALGSLANALSRLDRADDALAVYRTMISLDPTYDTAWLGAARVLRSKDQYAEAETMVRQVIAREPNNPDGYVGLGDVFLDQNRYPESEQAFRQALLIDPHASLASAGLGNCLNRAGRLDEAFAVLSKAAAADPSDHALTYNLGVVTERKGDLKGAMTLYQRAVALDDEHSMSWNNLGNLLERQGRHAEAITNIRKAHELDADNVEATYNLGALLVLYGSAAEAIPLLDAAMAQQPGIGRAVELKAKATAALAATQLR